MCFALFSCGFCKSPKIFDRWARQTHYDACFERNISCPEGCGQILVFSQLADHLENHCENVKITCPMFATGHCTSDCPGYGSRKDIFAHINFETVSYTCKSMCNQLKQQKITIDLLSTKLDNIRSRKGEIRSAT